MQQPGQSGKSEGDVLRWACPWEIEASLYTEWGLQRALVPIGLSSRQKVLAHSCLQGGKVKGSPKPEPADPGVKRSQAGRHGVHLSSGSQDFQRSH